MRASITFSRAPGVGPRSLSRLAGSLDARQRRTSSRVWALRIRSDQRSRLLGRFEGIVGIVDGAVGVLDGVLLGAELALGLSVKSSPGSRSGFSSQ